MLMIMKIVFNLFYLLFSMLIILLSILTILYRGGLTDLIAHPVGGVNTRIDYLILSLLYILVGTLIYVLFRIPNINKVLMFISTLFIIIIMLVNLFYLFFGSEYNWTVDALLPHVVLGICVSSGSII